MITFNCMLQLFCKNFSGVFSYTNITDSCNKRIVRQCQNLGLAWRLGTPKTCDYLCTCGGIDQCEVNIHVKSSDVMQPWSLCGISGIYKEVNVCLGIQ